MSSAPHGLTLWGHAIQCVCACPSGLFSGSVFISFYVFPHFFTSLFCLSVPSYPTARVRGNRRFLYSQMRTPLCSMSTCSHARHSQSPFRLSTCILQWLHFNRLVGVYFIVYLSQGSSHPTEKCRVTGVSRYPYIPLAGFKGVYIVNL
mgnify:CR=1 FL=1